VLARPPYGLLRAPNVFLETIKRGEDDDLSTTSAKTSVVLRLFEAYGGHASARLHLGRHANAYVSRVALTNLLEDELEELSVQRDHAGDYVELGFRGFEVKTVKITLKKMEKGDSTAERRV
jgi:alpha-mannosidase